MDLILARFKSSKRPQDPTGVRYIREVSIEQKDENPKV
jgi:hypothetical protein